MYLIKTKLFKWMLASALLLGACGQAPSREAALQATIEALQTQLPGQPPEQASPQPTATQDVAPSADTLGLADSTPTTTPGLVQVDKSSAMFRNWKIVIADVKSDWDGRSSLREGYQYSVVTLTFQNSSDTPADFVGGEVSTQSGVYKAFLSFAVGADGGYTYKPTAMHVVGMSPTYNTITTPRIPPKYWFALRIVTEVPDKATGTQLIITENQSGATASFDLNDTRQLEMPFPQTQLVQVGSDKMTIPEKFSATVMNVDANCYASFLFENPAGYDLKVGSGSVLGPFLITTGEQQPQSYIFEVFILQDTGALTSLTPTFQGFLSIAPGRSSEVNLSPGITSICKLTRPSRMIVSFSTYKGLTREINDPVLYRIYDLK